MSIIINISPKSSLNYQLYPELSRNYGGSFENKCEFGICLETAGYIVGGNKAVSNILTVLEGFVVGSTRAMDSFALGFDFRSESGKSDPYGV